MFGILTLLILPKSPLLVNIASQYPLKIWIAFWKALCYTVEVIVSRSDQIEFEAGVVILSSGSHASKNASGGFGKSAGQILVLVVLVAVLAIVVNKLRTAEPSSPALEPTAAPVVTVEPTVIPKETAAQPSAPATETPVETPEIVVTPTPVPEFHPIFTEDTDPDKFVKDLAVNVDGVTLAADEPYEPAERIDFMPGDEYTALEGVITFRGNNFRDTAAYGVAELKDYKFGASWFYNTGSLTAPDGEIWTGSGWVGQPLLVRWPKETKAIMNMYQWAKDDDALVEVIYATMDGNIYFLDLATGKQTRDTLHMGYTFKGAGALDPRGYPILYLGSGYNSTRGGSLSSSAAAAADFACSTCCCTCKPFVSYRSARPVISVQTSSIRR